MTLSIVCWHAFKSICSFVKHKLTYQLVNALYLLHDLFAPILRLHWNCYTHAGHLSNKEESLFKHAIKTVKDASQQGEQREMSAGISFIQWIMMLSFLITLRLWSVTGEAGEVCAQQPVSGTLRLWSVTDEAGEICAQQSVSGTLSMSFTQSFSITRSAGYVATAAQRGCTDRTIGHKANR